LFVALRIALELRNLGATNQSIAALSLPANVENRGMGHRKACYHHKIGQEITMPKVSLSGMTVEALMDLQTRVDEALNERRAEIEKQLKMFAVIGGRRVVRGGGSVLKGRKVPPKYRSPSGDTWAGRGARPSWLVAAIKDGKKLENFLIDKSGRKGQKRRRSKR
jgi:DNA-binding protein H-NS